MEDPQRWSGHGSWSRTRRASGQEPDFESPFCACRTVVGSYHGAVDHLHQVIAAAFSQRFQHQVPQPTSRPTAELLVHGVRVTQRIRQVMPRRAGPSDPENPVQRATVVAWRTAVRRHHEWLEERPLLIRQQATQHRRSPARRSASNHTAPRRGNPPGPLCPRNLAGQDGTRRRASEWIMDAFQAVYPSGRAPGRPHLHSFLRLEPNDLQN